MTDEPERDRSGDPTGSGRDAGRQGVNWQTVSVSILTSVLVALLGGGATVLATDMANKKDRDLRSDQVRAEQQEAARVKREQVYQAFLDAANDMAVEADAILATCQPPGGKPDKCEVRSLVGANHRYQGAINAIYIYGTPEAVAAMRRVATELPGGPGGRFTFKAVDHDRFEAAYVHFLDVVCRDVRPDPMQPCL